MRRHAVLLLLTLAACSGKGKEKTPPEPVYKNPAQAEAAIPANLKADYQHMLECEMRSQSAAGREPEIDTATVVRLSKAIRAGRRSPPDC